MNIKQVLQRNMKAVIAVVFVVLVGVAAWYIISNKKPLLGSYTVSKGNVVSSINLPGTVSSSNSVDLSFQESGQIATVYVKEGESVTQGETLASLDSSTQQTALSQEQAMLAAAQANYNKLLAGATQQSIQTSQDAVNSAKQNLTSTYGNAVNTLNSAYTSIYNAYATSVTMQNTYFSSADEQGIPVAIAKDDINSNMQSVQGYVKTAQKSMAQADIDTAISQTIVSLNSVYADVSTIRAQCDQGVYYYKVTAADRTTLDTQKTTINTVLTSVTVLQQNIGSLKLALQTAQDQLNVTTAPPTQTDIDAAKAQIASVQAQIHNAQLTVDHATIVAPFSGIIRNVVGVSGMVVSPNIPILSIINGKILKIDAYASETDVPQVQVNATAQVTLDTYGDGIIFPAKVAAVDTAGTVLNGSPAYHVTLYFTQSDDRIRTGMTGNVLILATEHDNVVKVPLRLVFDSGGDDLVLIKNGNNSIGRQVTLGLTGDDGMVEVVSGLHTGEKLSDF